MLIVAVLLSLVAIGIYVLVLIKLSLREGLTQGMLGLIFPPYTFYWGWRRVKRENLKVAMITWSAILGFLLLLVVWLVISNGG
jgi:hypothetical protein